MTKRISIGEFKALLRDYDQPVGKVTKAMANEVAEYYKVDIPNALFNKSMGKGVYKLRGKVSKDIGHLVAVEVAPTPVAVAPTVVAEAVKDITTRVNDIASAQPANYYVPARDPFYVKWSVLHTKLKTIVRNGAFCPVYITGLSGNGKTLTSEQIGAELKREVIIVNFTEETSEDDLLGSFRLIGGDTVWEDGPVITALKRGAVLILDEIDLGGARVMTLQSILSGKGVFIKKINKFVAPKEGFTVIATGNTKGKGDDGHGMMYTNLLNEALLDRFDATFEQDYPSVENEVKILKVAYENFAGSKPDADDIHFFDSIAKTGSLIRENYYGGGIDNVLSTRRLVQIVKLYNIFGKDRVDAFEMATARFDTETAGAMRDLYKAVDSGAHSNEGQPDDLSPPDAESEGNDRPF